MYFLNYYIHKITKFPIIFVKMVTKNQEIILKFVISLFRILSNKTKIKKSSKILKKLNKTTKLLILFLI